MPKSVLFGFALSAVSAFLVSAETEARADTVDSMVRYEVVGQAIPNPLTDVAGDSKRGKEIAVARRRGNCLSCHTMPVPEADHGETAPDLSGIADRMTVPEMRLRLVDAKLINPDTMMPSFYEVKRLHRVAKKFEGQTVLDAQEIEDVLAFLATLKKE
ncbi:MAG: sulfur oxidation c-type cytochrome SoxX [Magnetospiraceae bacterium]